MKTKLVFFIIYIAFNTCLFSQSDSSQQIAEVNIKSKKQFITKKLDKTIINPEALISNAGMSAVEVLEKSPGVLIDFNGVISLKGKSGVAIYIDDKPSYLKSEDLISYLKTIPSSLIDRIELMTNPSAKYDAAGNAGIINIVMKKNKTMGYSGGLSLSYGQGRHFRSSISGNLSYRINRLNFFTLFSITENNSYQDLTISRKYYDNLGNLNSSFVQKTLLTPEASGQNAKLGLDFYASDKTTCGFTVQALRNPTNKSVINNAELQNYSQNTLNYIQATNPTKQSLENLILNFNLQHKFDSSGRELSINVDRLNYDFLLEQYLTNSILNQSKQLESQSILASKLPATANILSFKLDYTTPLGKGKLDLGAKSSLVQTENRANFFDVNNGVQVRNNTFSNNFDYRENINALYLNYSRDFKNVSIQAGLRYENSNINGYQYGNPNQKDSTIYFQYADLFPTLYLQYNLDTLAHHQLNFSYGSRIDRPQYKDLNPFTYPMDRYTLYGGNPFLRSTYSHNFSLTHVVSFPFLVRLKSLFFKKKAA